MSLFKIREVDLAKLNSMTKYPSIPTYHVMGKGGVLTEEIQVPFAGRVIGTEKIDGTNARLIFCPDGSALVGSREDLLWEHNDLIGNPSMGIVDAVRRDIFTPIRRLLSLAGSDDIIVLYVEVFGKNIGAGYKNYTAKDSVSFRMFDAMRVADHERLLGLSREEIARWRDHGEQPFLNNDSLNKLAADFSIPQVPHLFDADASLLPFSHDACMRLLRDWSVSKCLLDLGGKGASEGIVIRRPDRSRIAKFRIEDYERAARRVSKTERATA